MTSSSRPSKCRSARLRHKARASLNIRAYLWGVFSRGLSTVAIHNLKCVCSYLFIFIRDIRPGQLEHTLLRVPMDAIFGPFRTVGKNCGCEIKILLTLSTHNIKFLNTPLYLHNELGFLHMCFCPTLLLFLAAQALSLKANNQPNKNFVGISIS